MAQLLVFVRLAVIDEIAGHDGDIGPWHQRVQTCDCTRQIWRSVELEPGPLGIRRGALHRATEQPTRRDDMGVRELGKDHVPSATKIASCDISQMDSPSAHARHHLSGIGRGV